MREHLNISLPYFAWIISLIAMTGNLFFSEVKQLPAHVFCWYRRALRFLRLQVLTARLKTRP